LLDKAFELWKGRHPLAVDAVLAVIESTLEWVRAVGGHALPAGAVTPFE
jgi:hypothetical protein